MHEPIAAAPMTQPEMGIFPLSHNARPGQRAPLALSVMLSAFDVYNYLKWLYFKMTVLLVRGKYTARRFGRLSRRRLSPEQELLVSP